MHWAQKISDSIKINKDNDATKFIAFADKSVKGYMKVGI